MRLFSKAGWVLLSLYCGASFCAASTHLPNPIQDRLNDGGFGPSLVRIPAGQFIMGAAPDEVGRFPPDGPTQVIHIKRSFFIGRFEVTFAEYDRFAEATQRAKPSDRGWGTEHWGRATMPVFNVSWFDAVAYTQWLSQQTGKLYRLPSEAEWEYAARAGTRSAFTSGSCITADAANFHSGYQHGDCIPSNIYRGKTVEVGSFPANNWGLHDVHGNVFEWTMDCWHNSREGAPLDGSAWLQQDTPESDFTAAVYADCKQRVLRGGSWSGRPRDLRLGFRAKNIAEVTTIFIGFRVLREE